MQTRVNEALGECGRMWTRAGISLDGCGQMWTSFDESKNFSLMSEKKTRRPILLLLQLCNRMPDTDYADFQCFSCSS